MQQNPNGTWLSMMQDGLSSVRGVYSGGVVSTQEYSPYGVPLDTMAETDFGFTGEVTDNNGLLFLRARYLNPAMGVFVSLDVFEGTQYPTNLNRYSWVRSNPPNFVDPQGLQASSSGTENCADPAPTIAIQGP